jgi:hypothetical protein
MGLLGQKTMEITWSKFKQSVHCCFSVLYSIVFCLGFQTCQRNTTFTLSMRWKPFWSQCWMAWVNWSRRLSSVWSPLPLQHSVKRGNTTFSKTKSNSGLTFTYHVLGNDLFGDISLKCLWLYIFDLHISDIIYNYAEIVTVFLLSCFIKHNLNCFFFS